MEEVQAGCVEAMKAGAVFEPRKVFAYSFLMLGRALVAAAAMTGTTHVLPRYVEIAVNLEDPMFRGVYHDKTKHPST